MQSLLLNGAGLAASGAFVFLVIAGAAGLHRTGLVGPRTARKLIHVALANWWFIAVAMFDDPWAASAGPACSLLAAVLAPRLRLFPADDAAAGTLDRGTICYSAALLVLVNLSWRGLIPLSAATTGVLVMGWGDGLAGLMGMKFGTRGVLVWGRRKTVQGTAVMFLASFAACFIVAVARGPRGSALFPAALISLSTAAVATAFELFTPWGLDNLTIPLGAALFNAGTFA